MGPSRSDHEPPGSGGPVGPRPVPELPGPVPGGPVTGAPVTGAPVTGAPVTGGPVPGGPVTDAPVTDAPVTGAPVTDDDRQRFGVLLDRALERGLLDPVEYQHRLGAIAAATTLEELRDLVTELPVLRTGAGVPVSGLGGGPGGGSRYGASGEAHQAWLASLGRPRYGATSGPRRSPWPVLVVVLVVLVLLVVILAVVGAHLARTHQQGLARPPFSVAVVGRPVAVAWFASTGRAERAPVPVSPSRL